MSEIPLQKGISRSARAVTVRQLLLVNGLYLGAVSTSGCKHGLSTEQVPVSAYVGSSKNLKVPKG